jgi:hypothetical protein
LAKVFVSYARQDAGWARELAGRLQEHGLEIFFDAWSLSPGDVVVHELEDAIREAADGIAVFGPGSVTEQWQLNECAALMRASVDRGLRFIPVLFGGMTIPPFAAHWIWRDFGNARGREYDDKVAELAREIRGLPPGDGQAGHGTPEHMPLSAPPRPLTPPEQRSVIVCYAPADAAYGRRLVEQLDGSGLPVWSVRSLRPGDRHVWTIRQQLRYATAIVVVMTPQAQDSDDITRMVLEGQWHGRPFFPILLRGDRHYQLANLWYVDGRAGGLLGARELTLLRRLHEAGLSDRPVSASELLPAPLSEPTVPTVRIPASVSLDRLRTFLAEGETEHADLLTTSLLLEAAGRLSDGWLRRADGDRLPETLLAGVDALWSDFSGGRCGFRAQLALVQVGSGRHAEFLTLSMKLGWRGSPDDAVPTYREFAGRAHGQPGFFPTLRNPQSEQYLDWYDQWTQTALTVHMRLREWGDRR